MPTANGRFVPTADPSITSQGRSLPDTDELKAVIAAVQNVAAAHFLEIFGLELSSSWSATADILWDETFAVGESICVTWIFHGTHVGPSREPERRRRPLPQDGNDDDRDEFELLARRDRRGLGFEGTGRPVHLKVISTGKAALDGGGTLTGAELNHTRWDSLSAIGQIGVQALGRPVLDAPILELRR